MKTEADKKLGRIKPEGVVMGVPYGTSEKIKSIYLRALVKAGFYKTEETAEEKTEFVDEPVAVALYYGNQAARQNKYSLVFDFGGGTLDMAIVQLNPDGKQHKVVAKSGYSRAGEEFTKLLFLNVFFPAYGPMTVVAPSKYGIVDDSGLYFYAIADDIDGMTDEMKKRYYSNPDTLPATPPVKRFYRISAGHWIFSKPSIAIFPKNEFPKYSDTCVEYEPQYLHSFYIKNNIKFVDELDEFEEWYEFGGLKKPSEIGTLKKPSEIGTLKKPSEIGTVQ